MPYRLTRPYVGLSPTTPVSDAGQRIEPPVSVPIAARHSPAARAAAEPPLDPPALRSRSQGLQVGGESVPYANSCVTTFPRMIAPASSSRAVTALSSAATWPSLVREPHRVGTSATSYRSLSAT